MRAGPLLSGAGVKAEQEQRLRGTQEKPAVGGETKGRSSPVPRPSRGQQRRPRQERRDRDDTACRDCGGMAASNELQLLTC